MIAVDLGDTGNNYMLTLLQGLNIFNMKMVRNDHARGIIGSC
jgi:hypothetical protein